VDIVIQLMIPKPQHAVAQRREPRGAARVVIGGVWFAVLRAIGVAAATFAPTLLMCGMPWLPYPKTAAWLASLLFLAIVFWLSLVALFAVTPLMDLKLVMGLR
jgi:hypothetical protein